MPDIKMPQLGESVTEGTIGKWLKAVGDTVAKYEPIAEVITDKVTAEVPSDFDGVMEELLIPEGETVKVGTVICRVATEGDATGNARPTTEAMQDEAKTSHVEAGSAAGVSQAETKVAPAEAATGSRPIAKGRFSPAVLRLAEENDVDLSLVSGTGEGGRITRKDVLLYVSTGQAKAESAGLNPQALDANNSAIPADRAMAVPASDAGRQGTTRTPVHESARPSGMPEAAAQGDDEWIEPSPIRKTIARRMIESKHNAPHAWTMVEADVTRLAEFRGRAKSDFKRREGIDLTYLPFFIKAVVEALKQFPMLNASWIDDKIVMHRHINISIAVATDDALVVPVIHDADRLSIAGLAHRVNELAAKARSNRLTMDDIQGGTFTVNNTGAFGSILSQPILNSPQSAILSVESIVKRPVVVENDAIAIRSIVNLCLSLDHRILDGWVAGQFLRAVRERLGDFDAKTVLY